MSERFPAVSLSGLPKITRKDQGPETA